MAAEATGYAVAAVTGGDTNIRDCRRRELTDPGEVLHVKNKLAQQGWVSAWMPPGFPCINAK